jgi:hypothetical protein
MPDECQIYGDLTLCFIKTPEDGFIARIHGDIGFCAIFLPPENLGVEGSFYQFVYKDLIISYSSWHLHVNFLGSCRVLTDSEIEQQLPELFFHFAQEFKGKTFMTRLREDLRPVFPKIKELSVERNAEGHLAIVPAKVKTSKAEEFGKEFFSLLASNIQITMGYTFEYRFSREKINELALLALNAFVDGYPKEKN